MPTGDPENQAETTAVAVRQSAAPAIRQEFTEEQVDLIRKICCAGSTNDELALFLMQCRRTGLDPLSKQIHAVKRGGKLTIQVGIDGLRLIAERTGETNGQDGPHWCGEDGVWKDVWLGPAKPTACKVTVFRKGQAHGYTGVARWAEFYSSAGGMWDKMPAVMIAKVAESIALRKGFPQEMSGIYTDDEMGQADATAIQQQAHRQQSPPPPPAAPPPPAKPAERWTIPTLAARVAGRTPPASAAELTTWLKWLVPELRKLVPDFAESDLRQMIENEIVDLPDNWTVEKLDPGQSKGAWQAVSMWLQGEAGRLAAAAT